MFQKSDKWKQGDKTITVPIKEKILDNLDLFHQLNPYFSGELFIIHGSRKLKAKIREDVR